MKIAGEIKKMLWAICCLIHHLVCRRGIGREMHKNGSKVLLCLRQWGHVREDLKKKRERERANFNHSCQV